MRPLLIALFIFPACVSLHAADSKPSQTAPAVVTGTARVSGSATAISGTAATSGTTAYLLKQKSYFTGTSKDHNPFWPIGWSKTAIAGSGYSTGPAVVVAPHAEDFVVTSILLNEPPLCVINGKELAEGEIATLPTAGGQMLTVQLIAVQDGHVVLRWQNQNLTIPLHRNEVLSQVDPTPAKTSTTQ
jgi:hypothetical protein